MFKIDFRELSFNQKIALVATALLLAVGLLIALGIILKSIQNTPTKAEDNTSELNEPSSTAPTEIPEIFDYAIKNETNPGNEYSDYVSKYFTNEELGLIGGTAMKASMQLCTKSLNETTDSVTNRLSPYFVKPDEWTYRNGGESTIEATCNIGGLGPVQINTKDKTIKYEVYGTRYTISSSESNKPADERIINENDFTYIFVIENINGQWLIVSEDF